MFNKETLKAKEKLNHSALLVQSWVSLVAPTEEDLETVAKNFLIPYSMLIMHRSNNRGTAIENHADLFSFVIALPNANAMTDDIPYSIVKMTVVVIDRIIITVIDQPHPILKELNASSREKFAKTDVTDFILNLFQKNISDYLLATHLIGEKVDEVEGRLQASITNKQVFELLNNNKGYLFFIRALKHNGSILIDLEKKRLLVTDHKADLVMMDILVANEQAQKMTEIQNANLRNLMDAYSAAIENNLSLAVQYLTIFVTIAAIPMAIAGIYGMNTPLPIQEEPYALALLAGITILIAIAVITFFKVRRYI